MRHFLLLIFLSSLSLVSAQEYTVSDRKAIKNFEVGRQCFNHKDHACVIKRLDDALASSPDFVEAHLLMFESYVEMKEYDKAEESLIKALTIDPDFYKNGHYYYAEFKMNKGDYSTAKVAYEKFLSYRQINPNLLEDAERKLANCQFAESAMENPVPFDPQNMGPAINSEWSEYFPSLTTDDKTLLITRRLPTEKNEQEDFFISSLVDGKWTQMQPLRSINSERNEGAPSISPDGQLLIFTSCADNTGSYGDELRGMGSCDLFYSFRDKANGWTQPRNMGSMINSSHWETQPSFSSDGRTIYFVRGIVMRDRSIKNQDIWTSRLDELGDWTKAEKLPEVINTPFDESSVLIHPDDQTLYFTSNGHPGMGGEDIYLSRRQEDGSWGTPLNLGYPINTSGNENSITVLADGNVALFASNREGGYGGLDLYSFELAEGYRPIRVTYLEGTIVDKDTQEPVSGRIELIDLITEKVVVETYASQADGTFLVSLPEGRDYALNVTKKGYLFHSENFSLATSEGSEPYKKRVELSPIKAGASVVLKNVFFETGSYALGEQSKVELNKLVEFLTLNYRMKIEIGGHTDNVGKVAANQILSQNRASSVKQFLMDKGVPEERMTSQGYGDTQPIADNESEEGRAQNRRTEFKVTSLE